MALLLLGGSALAERKGFGQWIVDHYTGDFSDQRYIGSPLISGSFSNFSDKYSNAYMELTIDLDDTYLQLYEYDALRLVQAESKTTYTIQVRSSDGSTVSTTGTMYAGGDTLFIDDPTGLVESMQNSPSISIYIAENRSSGVPSTYLFSNINTSGFTEAWDELGKPAIVIDISVDKWQIEINETVTVTYSISGGSGSFEEMEYEWFLTGVQFKTLESGTLNALSGQIAFTPNEGPIIQMYIYAMDSAHHRSVVYSDAIMVSGCVLRLPENLKSLEKEAFAGLNRDIIEVLVPDSVTYIADDAFSGYDIVDLYGTPGGVAEAFANSHVNCFFHELD